MEREESIIQSIQKGEYDQFEKLYHYYFSHIFSFIFVKTNGNKSLTDDICSEVFLKAFEKIKDFTYQNGNFRAWLFTIAYHTFLDFIKDQTSYSLQDWEVIDDNNFCDFFEKKERAKDILLFLESLGTDKKDLFLLRVWNQMSYNEIGAIIGKSEEACRKEFSRILKRLLEKYHQ